ncbi:Gap junction delta-2 protein [Lonchura striata]|uniref:Gap junction protein n=1 Tax=Lonchura striata TaxID=40157 RepID=A0A218UBE1_9PASE|nr:Gap junction delta-2 protein [Lonchura striata domestica]
MKSVWDHQILLTVVVIFRILIVAIVGETVYEDEQTMFMCNTLQPGCNQACYDSAFPISHIRYWVFQIILVCTPSLCFITYSVHQAAKQRERRCSCLAPLLEPRPEPPAPRPARSAKAKRQEGISRFYVIQEDLRTSQEDLTLIPNPHLSSPCPGGVQEDLRPVPNSHLSLLAQVVFRNALEISHLSPTLTCPLLPRWCSGTLWRSHTCPSCPGGVPERSGDPSPVPPAQVVFRNALEIGFLGGQYFLYGFNVPAIFECDRYPCVKEVECYVSRPTEKSVFLVFMFAVSGVCVLLNLAELNHLGWRKVRAAVRGARARRKSLGEARRREAAAPALGRTQSSESAYV